MYLRLPCGNTPCTLRCNPPQMRVAVYCIKPRNPPLPDGCPVRQQRPYRPGRSLESGPPNSAEPREPHRRAGSDPFHVDGQPALQRDVDQATSHQDSQACARTFSALHTKFRGIHARGGCRGDRPLWPVAPALCNEDASKYFASTFPEIRIPGASPVGRAHARSKRSRFMTLFQAATKSHTNACCESSQA